MKISSQASPKILVTVSADAEWRVVEDAYAEIPKSMSPFGCWFTAPVGRFSILFFQSGWGKISAAASTQYAIQRWNPRLIINIGTCGGFRGEICSGDILLAEETVVYDILEQMGDQQEALAYYTTVLDLSWLQAPYPIPVKRGRLISADRDILAQDIPLLKSSFGATASDWESAAIAWAAKRNNVACLILRGVSDLVDPSTGGEAYGRPDQFIDGSRSVMQTLLESLPGWLQCAQAVIE
jgi:adenosylhomocysteine nucleosidase